MDLLQNIYLGFSAALVPARLFACFSGVLIGTLVGVLPGLGPAAAIALLLPSTFHLDPYLRDHHACGHLLWSHVRGLHHFYFGEYSRRSRFCGYLPGRVSNGPEGKSGPGIGHQCLRLVHRRDSECLGPDAGRAASSRVRLFIRPAGVFFSNFLRALHFNLFGERFHSLRQSSWPLPGFSWG